MKTFLFLFALFQVTTPAFTQIVQALKIDVKPDYFHPKSLIVET